jgi:tRNA-dihydrouridine synthase B
MSIQIGPLKLATPVVLAPMAGVTDGPFRAAVRRYGSMLVYSEMVASAELLRDRRAAMLRLRHERGDGPFAIQLAGRDPIALADAARMAEAEGADLIDVNMGCPAKKVVGGLCGSALMREPDLARTLVKAVIEAVRVPVTVKMRTGWDESSRNAVELARVLEGEGVRMIAVHGRTRCQFYEGRADWAFIAEVKAKVSIPILANGDVVEPIDAVAIIKASGADGVMIGRGAFGRPWFVGQASSALQEQQIPADPPLAERWQVALDQYRAALAHYGEVQGRRVMRKHLGWYAEQAGQSVVRGELVQMSDPEPLLISLAAGEQPPTMAMAA